MKKQHLIFILLFSLTPLFLLSQSKQLSIEDASYMNRDIMPESVRGLSWMGETPYFTFTEGNSIMVSKTNAYEPETLLSLDDINSCLVKLDEDSLRRLPSFRWIDDNTGYLRIQKMF